MLAHSYDEVPVAVNPIELNSHEFARAYLRARQSSTADYHRQSTLAVHERQVKLVRSVMHPPPSVSTFIYNLVGQVLRRSNSDPADSYAAAIFATKAWIADILADAIRGCSVDSSVPVHPTVWSRLFGGAADR